MQLHSQRRDSFSSMNAQCHLRAGPKYFRAVYSAERETSLTSAIVKTSLVYVHSSHMYRFMPLHITSSRHITGVDVCPRCIMMQFSFSLCRTSLVGSLYGWVYPKFGVSIRHHQGLVMSKLVMIGSSHRYSPTNGSIALRWKTNISVSYYWSDRSHEHSSRRWFAHRR